MKQIMLLLLILAFGASLFITNSDVNANPIGDIFSFLTPSPIKSATLLPRDCIMCKFLISLINYSLKSKSSIDQVAKMTSIFCTSAKLETPDVCLKVTYLFKDEIVKVLRKTVFSPDQICGAISGNKCGNYHNPMADWEVNLNASLELDPESIRDLVRQKEELKDKMNHISSKPYKVIQISDTHVDLSYQTDSLVSCAEPLCCRNSSTLSSITYKLNTGLQTVLDTSILYSKTVKEKAGYWGSYGNCDIPLRTFENTLQQLNKTISNDNTISYIIWTGDIQPHDVWMQSKQQALKTYHEVFKLIFSYLPNVTIYPALGNHEMVPVDSFSPSNLKHYAGPDSPQWLYDEMNRLWQRWLPAETMKTLAADGFYAVKIWPNLKLVSLNTNFCVKTNFWLYINSTDPGNQLQWLIHELQISELMEESVHIIGHVPPGSDDCLGTWSKNYNRIVRRFKHTITGQFFGHTHNGEFQIFHELPVGKNITNSTTEFKLPEPVAAAFVAPSVTTYVGLNPGFRVFHINPNSKYTPTDFESYHMNLTRANSNLRNNNSTSQIDNSERMWNRVGSFVKAVNITDLSPQSLQQLLIDALIDLRSESSKPAIIEPFRYDEDKKDLKVDNSSNKQALGLYPDKQSELAASGNKLFELYKIFYSYSDLLTRKVFDDIPKKEKVIFLCRFLTSQSHDTRICDEFLRLR